MSSYHHARDLVRRSAPKPGAEIRYHKHGGVTHRERREGDEKACSCGSRWPAHEEHPK